MCEIVMKKIIILLVGLCIFSLAWGESIPKDSIYNLKSSWIDQNNEKLKLEKFMGQKIIIGMIYTKCPQACPMTIAKIQEIKKAIGKTKEKYKVVLASFDSINDNPDHLKKYMKGRKLNENDWTFLFAPNDETVRELAAVLGINYKRLEDGHFSHSNIITVLDSSGIPLAKINSLSASVDPIVNVFKK